MTEEIDPLLAGRGGLDYAALDAAARRIHAELTELAVDQISRPIAHEFDIRIDVDGTAPSSPPPGYRRPARGSITTRVDARSRSRGGARASVRVTVWPALGGADVSDLLVVREGSAQTVPVPVAEAHPRITPALRRRLSDFVATAVAATIARLYVEMQRQVSHRDWQYPPEEGR